MAGAGWSGSGAGGSGGGGGEWGCGGGSGGGGVRDGGVVEAVPGVVFELPGCRSGGVRREGGRFFSLGFDEREARIDELIAGSQKLVGRINADQAALAANTTELLGLFQAGQGWGWGWRTPAHRLACQLKLTGAEARRLVTAADVLPDLPQLAEAFGHGEVSLPVVAALAQVATADTEAELVEQSRHATADAMLGLVSTFKRLDAEAGDRPPRPESLSLRARADGYEIRGFLDSVNGAVLEKRLAQRRNELFDQTGTAATSADALLSLLEVGPRPVSPQFLAVLQIDVEVFRAWQETRHRPSGCPTCGTSSDVAGNGQASTGGHGPGSDSPTGVSVLHGPPVTEAELDAIHQELSVCWLVSRNGHPLWISIKAPNGAAVDAHRHDGRATVLRGGGVWPGRGARGASLGAVHHQTRNPVRRASVPVSVPSPCSARPRSQHRVHRRSGRSDHS